MGKIFIVKTWPLSCKIANDPFHMPDTVDEVNTATSLPEAFLVSEKLSAFSWSDDNGSLLLLSPLLKNRCNREEGGDGLVTEDDVAVT